MTTATASRFEELLSTRATIARPRPLQAAGTATYEFGGGLPDPASFPYAGILEATARMLEAEGAEAMTYGDPQGYRGLRELVCDKYERYEGLQITPDSLVVANGSGHALSLAFSALLDVGDPMICEAPTFHGTLFTIRRHGPEILDVPVDAEGIVTDAVRVRLETLRRQGRRCKLIYTIDNFQNPAGPTMSRRRREALIALAQEFGTLILEDDAYGELRFEGEPIPSLYALDDSGCVIRAGTLSKTLGAGVRLGWLCASKEMLPYLQGFNFGGGVSPFMSRVATYYMREHMVEHIALLVDVYREKRDQMLRGLWEPLEGTDAEISHPEGGFFLWLKLPTGADPARLAELADEAGVRYVAGPTFFPNGGGERNVRLAYSYESPEKCYQGGKLFAECIRKATA
ncbi:MAG: PLP-dependent aminotransferase family protein [Chloroflexi bacterium]|nr:PLP-dependent aminotransferase family protein [Chloroflexota bacterium]